MHGGCNHLQLAIQKGVQKWRMRGFQQFSERFTCYCAFINKIYSQLATQFPTFLL